MKHYLVIALFCEAALLASSSARATELAAPSGFQGAGLGMGEQRARVWTELAFHTQERMTVFAPTLGAGYRIVPNLEVEAILPMAYGSFKLFRNDDSGFGVGNPRFGVNWVNLDGSVRYKIGLGITAPLAPDEGAKALAVGFAAGTFGVQDADLWVNKRISASLPVRIEAGERVVVSADAAVAALFPTGDSKADTEAYLQAAPGVGVYASDNVLIGVRVPIFWVFTNDSGDNAQVALEPYVRGNIGAGFLNARFTMNLDEPYGFAFDEGRVWGAHVGGGLTF